MAVTGASPRKVIPLNSGDEARSQTTNNPSKTSRAFFCGVVVESGGSGELTQDLRSLVSSLGDHISSSDGTVTRTDLPDLPSETHNDISRTRSATNASALGDVLNEFVSTERSYVKRLRVLKESYADPLRTFARAKESAILPAYEAKTLFGNIDNILAVNQAFLADLEKMMQSDRATGGIGDVALKHFKNLRAFDSYKQYYSKREEAQMILKREKLKKSSTGFAAFVDHTKESTADLRNRVGLSELLMDPIQRIPRYTLLWELMIKYMPNNDPQRAMLIEASQIAQKIAKAEIDDPTKRAAVWHCLERSVEGFPPGLISNGRRFIDCIDVDDIPVEVSPSSVSVSTSSSGHSSSSTLHCTLFLFDDKLMIVKRPHASAAGKTLTGLDQLDKATKTGGLPLGIKKNGMSFKGVIDIADVVATDVGSSDMHIYLEVPPQDQSDRWSGRPFRALSVVHPSSTNLDPVLAQNDKHRFLEHLWTAQALYRAKQGRSVVLCSTDSEVECRAGRVTLARAYFNIYQRTAYMGEPKKPKVVLHLDASGAADRIPFGVNGPPYVVIRAQPMAGELCRYAVSSSDPHDEEEVDIVHTTTVPERLMQTIHQYGLFKFRTGKNSAPSTPTASTRSRTAIFGLDAISRNIFPIGKGGDVFGTVLNNNNPKRSRSAASRTSTQTVTTVDSAVKFSTRSTSTAATSLMLDEDSPQGNSPRKLQRGRKSYNSGRQSPSRSRSLSQSRESRSDYSARDDDEDRSRRSVDESEWDLNTRLALARRNSRNQEAKDPQPLLTNPPVEDTIYEEEPPAATVFMPKSTNLPTTPTRRNSSTPTKENTSSPRKGRAPSTDRRPMGPRAPSPLPPRSPDFEAVENTLENLTYAPVTPTRQAVKPSPSVTRSRRLPLEPKANDAIPMGNIPTTGSVEPLSIKKKTSVRSGHGASPPSRSRHGNEPARGGSVRQGSPQLRGVKRTISLNDHGGSDLSSQVLIIAQSTREDVDSVRRVVKRIKLEVTALRTLLSRDDAVEGGESELPAHKGVLPRSPHMRHMSAKSEANARKEEMRQVIAMRQVESPIRRRDDTTRTTAVNHTEYGPVLEEWTATVESLVGQSERELKRATANQELLHADLKVLTSELKEKSAGVLTVRAELQSTKRQFELVKNLLADATAENDILHKAFNEELDGMFNDANLPETEAWTAMTKDLRETKGTRNTLKRENASLKRRLEEVEMQKEEWGAILRAHGLIP